MPPPVQQLVELIFGFRPAQLVYVMARLRIADVLDGGSMTIDELSGATDAQPGMVRRIVRGLASLGLVDIEAHDRISLTDMGALLHSRSDGSLRDVALHQGGDAYAAWGELEHAVRTGQAAFEVAHGDRFFDHLRDNLEAGAAFDGMMTCLSRGVVDEVAAHYDFADASRVLDVGGGRGHLLAAVLGAHPELRGAVLDVPDVTDAAREHLHQKRIADRATAVDGDFFDSVPTGYDVHVLKWILHDWNDEACARLLAACRTALPDHGRLLVVEQLLPETVPTSGVLPSVIDRDLGMLVNFADAGERDLGEYEQLLAEGGFALRAVVSLPSGFSILDCRPVEAAA